MEHAILVVDDSALVRATTTRRLAAHGLRVTALASSQEASGVDPTRFSAALLDIDLGDGSGPEVAAHLRMGAPGLPIAFLTGRTEGGVLHLARTFGPVFSKVDGLEEAIGWVVASLAG